MRPQTLISISTAFLIGLMTLSSVVEAAPVKMQATPMKSATPAKRAVVKPAQINIVKAILKPGTAKTKGKYTLKVTLHNPTATRASAFTVKVLHRGREVGKTKIKGLKPRARVTRTLRLSLPKLKGKPCVTVRLVKLQKSTLKLGTPRRTCLKSSMVRRGITKTKLTTRGRIKTIKGQKRLGIKYLTIPDTLTVNGQNTTVTAYSWQGIATVKWSVPSGLTGNPNRVVIRVHPGAFTNIPNECQTGGGDTWRSAPQSGLSGQINIPLNSLTSGQTYQVKGCLENSGTGNTGDESNVVTLKYQAQELTTCILWVATIVGTPGNDVINGTPGDDVIHGLGGNDTIRGGGGNDVICGGDGNDKLYGQDGNDKLYGNDGTDLLSGGSGNDQLSGGSGNDFVYGDAGDDVLKGGGGNDFLRGDAGDDKLYGGPGNDFLRGGAGRDLLYGHAGRDTLWGDDGDDILKGGPDKDTLYGGDGLDRLYVGDGGDVLNDSGGGVIYVREHN